MGWELGVARGNCMGHFGKEGGGSGWHGSAEGTEARMWLSWQAGSWGFLQSDCELLEGLRPHFAIPHLLNC